MRFKIVFVALSTLIALAGCLRTEPQAEVMARAEELEQMGE